MHLCQFIITSDKLAVNKNRRRRHPIMFLNQFDSLFRPGLNINIVIFQI